MLSIILLQKEKKMEKIKALIVLMSLALSPMALAGMGHKKMKMMKSEQMMQQREVVRNLEVVAQDFMLKNMNH